MRDTIGKSQNWTRAPCSSTSVTTAGNVRCTRPLSRRRFGEIDDCPLDLARPARQRVASPGGNFENAAWTLGDRLAIGDCQCGHDDVAIGEATSGAVAAHRLPPSPSATAADRLRTARTKRHLPPGGWPTAVLPASEPGRRASGRSRGDWSRRPVDAKGAGGVAEPLLGTPVGLRHDPKQARSCGEQRVGDSEVGRQRHRRISSSDFRRGRNDDLVRRPWWRAPVARAARRGWHPGPASPRRFVGTVPRTPSGSCFGCTVS